MPPAPPAAELPPLPAPRGPARAVATVVDPRSLHLYWVGDEPLLERLSRAGGSAEIRLDRRRDDDTWDEVGRVEFDFRAPGWYVELPAADCRLRARLGMRRGGDFDVCLTSNTVRVPRLHPAEGEVAFRAVGGPEDAAGAPAAIAGAGPAPPTPGGSSPGARPAWMGAGAAPAAGAPGTTGGWAGGEPLAYVAFVLHAHLPFVRHPERAYFLEEQWLFEAITETYLPLLDAFDHLLEDGVPAKVTMSLTPTLAAMLRDPLLIEKYEEHLDRMCDLARREVERTRRDPEFSPIAGLYHDRLERLRHLYTRAYGRDLVAELARLEAAGILEIIACAATHAFLPHLAIDPGTARAQIAVGVAEHHRHLGRAPRGMWLPECAWFDGLDRMLAREGVDHVFLDSHALRNASVRPRFDVYAPTLSPSGVAVFGRDPECAAQVWSSESGYPGDPDYRDFYRDIGYDLDHAYVAPFLDPAGTRGMTGFKYHRITGRTDAKRPYRRSAALRAVQRHARDFVERRAGQARRLRDGMDRPPLAVAMYDAELFGHWWFEGPEWLENVLRLLPRHGLRPLAPGDYLALHPHLQQMDPSPSSWGEGGYSRVWLNTTNDWILPPLHDAGRRMASLAEAFARPSAEERRLLAQAGRELLLAQASDWPFILKHRTAVGYARRRVHEHLDRFDRLARVLEARRAAPRSPGAAGQAPGAAPGAAAAPPGAMLDDLARIEAEDNLFPHLDPAVWRTA